MPTLADSEDGNAVAETENTDTSESKMERDLREILKDALRRRRSNKS